MEVVNSESRPEFLTPLRDLFLAEWNEIDSFEGNRFRSNPPAPLLAIEKNTLIGGLSFTWYCPEGFSEIKLWINALYVKPEYRTQGIATSLIKKATRFAAQTGESKLYVNTEVPQLYTQLGWQTISSQGKNHVLKTKLLNNGENI